MKYWRPIKAHRNLLVRGILAGLVLLSGNILAQDTPVRDDNDAAFRRVSNRLLCQCGCSYLVLSCNMVDCSFSLPIRKAIQTSLAAGQSEDAIVAGFVETYGPRIMPEPPRSGFSLTAWVMPFAMLLLGAMLVSYVLWQWKNKFRPATAGTAPNIPGGVPSSTTSASSALVDKYRAQIDRELED